MFWFQVILISINFPVLASNTNISINIKKVDEKFTL